MEDEVLKLVDAFNQDYVGSGAECVVVVKRGEKRKVEAITYSEMTPLKAKQTFYVHRILETLFPHNFPHFYAVSGGVKGKPDQSGSIRQRVEAKFEVESPYTKTFGAYDRLNPKYPFSEVLKKVKSLRIPVGFDDTGVNFVLAADGGVYYLDTVIPFSSPWDIQHIEEYMQTHNYDKTEIEIVKKSVRRLMELKVQ